MQAKNCYGAKGMVNDCEKCEDVVEAHAKNGTFKIEDVDGWHQCKDQGCDNLVNTIRWTRDKLIYNGHKDAGESIRFALNPKKLSQCQGFSRCYNSYTHLDGTHNDRMDCNTCAKVNDAQRNSNWYGQIYLFPQCHPYTYNPDTQKDEPLRGWDDPL